MTIALSIFINTAMTPPDAAELRADIAGAMERLGATYELLHTRIWPSRGEWCTDTETLREPPYACALKQAMDAAEGRWLLTLTRQWRFEIANIGFLWDRRSHADVIIGRYPRDMLHWLDRLSDELLSETLDIGARGLLCGFRLYRLDAVREINVATAGHCSLIELAVRASGGGWKVVDVQLAHSQREAQHARPNAIAKSLYLRDLLKLWMFRNSIGSADYDARAYQSRHPFQRYWQRRRLRIVSEMLPRGVRVLDLGCGSSRTLSIIPGGIGLDIQLNKLRFSTRYGRPLVNADAFHLPFEGECFDYIVCSQLIEHLPRDERIFREMARVLRPGGYLVIGTPDYATVLWPVIEALYRLAAPNAYADEHITHYSRSRLDATLVAHGFVQIYHRYVCHAELIALYRYGLAQPYPYLGSQR